MIVACAACEADLRINRNLAGTTMSCPECGERFEVPAAPPERSAPATPRSTSKRRPKRDPKDPAPPLPMSLSLLGAQALLIVLAVICFLGAFFRASWNPPEWSFMQENVLLLTGVGIGLIIASAAARRYPIVSTLTVVLAILVICALHYRTTRVVDASRVLALSLSMVALWLAMEHRGVT